MLRSVAALTPGAAARLHPAPSELAALAARKRPLQSPESPQVVFLLPLVGQHHVTDWDGVSARLVRTLESFLRQSSPTWRAVICGQTKPERLPADDRIQWLPFPEKVDGNDKWRKLAALSAALPECGISQGYAMPFDADDLLAPHVVEEMLQTRATGGYLVERGYVHDASTGGWAETHPQSLVAPGQKAFWKLCGSCAAFAFDLSRSSEDAAFIGAITAHEHRMFPYLARLAGRPLSALSPGAALYILNHGDNFGARRGRTSFKTRYVARFALNDPHREAELAATFGLSEVPNAKGRPTKVGGPSR